MEDFKKIEDQYNNLLSDKNIDDILKTLEENKESSENLKLISDISEGKIDTSVDLENVQSRQNVMINVDPKTGEKRISHTIDDINNTSFSESISSINKDNYSTEITESEIKDGITELDLVESDDFEISDASVLKLLEIIKRIKNNEKFNIYKELPKEVKELVDKICKNNGAADNSVRANTARNRVSELLINNYIKTLEKKRYNKGPISKLESAWKGNESDLINFFNNYKSNKEKYLKEIQNDIIEEDSKMTEQEIYEFLDIFCDSYYLEKLLEFAPKIKIKKIEFEKPQKIFSSFESKFRDKEEYNISSIFTAFQVLERHNKNNTENNLKFLIGFCKFCDSFKVENINEFVFMFNVINNITLLDILNREQYEEFSVPFIERINSIAEKIRGSMR